MDAEQALDAERWALCDTFARVGPDAPTLCEGWTAADVAAHFILVERRPDAAPGIALGGPFARHTARVMEQQKAGGFDAMVDRLRRPLPLLMRKGPAAVVNANHHLIHHEDVRRANGEGPRRLDRDLDEVAWSMLAVAARLAMRRVPVGVEAVAPDGRHRVMRKGAPMVTVSGEPSEITLFCNGRTDAASVELSGPDEAVERLRRSPMGI